ncbi:hypothetical protein [Streptomyces sp. bgisy130]|uniref:hypothetical protein n=1 Tax=Streptomyces sp. bgisy130 TaxID=3413788 RepID=UPI003F4A1BC6
MTTMARIVIVLALVGVSALFGVVQPTGTDPRASTTTPNHVAAMAAGHGPARPAQPIPDPADVVDAYFTAINNGEYVAAWTLGGRHITGRPYDSFVQSFNDTTRDDVTIRSVTGNTVEVELDATQTDGTHRYFAGTYTVEDGVIVAAHIHRA